MSYNVDYLEVKMRFIKRKTDSYKCNDKGQSNIENVNYIVKIICYPKN